MKLNDIARCIGVAIHAEYAQRDIVGLNSLELARADELVFVENDRYLDALKQTKAGAALVRQTHKGFVPDGTAAIICPEPYLAMAQVSALFAPPLVKTDGEKAVIGTNTRVLANVHIGSNAVIGDNCLIMNGAFIGDGVTIGENVTIHPNVCIYNNSVIGNRVIIHAGSVIGSDGFGYAHTRTGEHIKIVHFGRVVIEEDVEIGANCAIDRAVLGETFIRCGAKLDNLVNIAHNCVIGEHSLLTAQFGMAGSTTIGRNFVCGGQPAVAGHLRIGDFVTVAGKSGVTKNLTKGTYGGFPAMEHRKWLKSIAKILSLIDKQPK